MINLRSSSSIISFVNSPELEFKGLLGGVRRDLRSAISKKISPSDQMSEEYPYYPSLVSGAE